MTSDQSDARTDHFTDGTDRSTCKHCDEQIDEDENVCLDCYVLAHSVNSGFPV